MAVTAQYCLKFLQDMDSFPPSSKKLVPIAATPAELAYCCGMLHKYNEQKKIPRRIKDDPVNLPMSLPNFVAEHLDIPECTNMFPKHPHLLEPSASDSVENSSQQPSAADVVKAVPFIDTSLSSLGYHGFDRDHLLSSPIPAENPSNSATGSQIFPDYKKQQNNLSCMNDDF
jgi:hypothetical protein